MLPTFTRENDNDERDYDKEEDDDDDDDYEDQDYDDNKEEDVKDVKDHEDDKDDEDDEDMEDHDDKITSKDNKCNEDQEDDDMGAFSNEVEGRVPGAPHSTLIKKLQILNQTPTYRRSIIENEKIDLLIKKLLQMKLRVGRTKKKQLENTELVGWLDKVTLLKFSQK